MKPDACRNIEIKVGVMNHVEAPQGRYRMKQDMLEIDDEIKDNDRRDDFQDDGSFQMVQYPPIVFSGLPSHTRGGRCEQKPEENRIQKNNSEIGGPPLEFGGKQETVRRDAFPCGHDQKNSEKKGQADEGFVFNHYGHDGRVKTW